MPYTLEPVAGPGRSIQWAAVQDESGRRVFTSPDKTQVEQMTVALNEQEQEWAVAHNIEPPVIPQPNRSALVVVYDVLFAVLQDDVLPRLVSSDATYVEIDNVLAAIDNGDELEDPISRRNLRLGREDRRPGRPDRPETPAPRNPRSLEEKIDDQLLNGDPNQR